jgi:bile acid:Na+ symporter, BASS family
MNKKLSLVLLAMATISFAGFILFQLSDSTFSKGPFLISGFVLLALAVRGFKAIKGFSYSLWIFTAVSASMYFPQYFLSVGDFKLTLLIVPLLQIIMFGMGSQMSLKDLAGVIKMPRGVIIGVMCQFTIMPIIGISLAVLFRFPPEIAAGIVLVGTSPSGLASNVMSFLARANLALSVTLTAIATLLSPLLTPLLMKMLAGQMVEISFWKMMIDIFNMVILPIVAGLIFNLFSQQKIARHNAIQQLTAFMLIMVLKNVIALAALETLWQKAFSNLLSDILIFGLLPVVVAMAFKYVAKGDRELLNKALAFISMLGIGIIITVITAAGRDSLLDVGLLLILACLIHNLSGYGIGYSITRYLFRLPEADCRTVALEVGMQNGGLASGLAMQMGKIATVGLAPAVFGPLMNITGSSLATWWRNKGDKREENKAMA